MTVYLINILLILLWNFLFADKSKKLNRAWFCGLSAFQWILISGLRSLNIGADTERYANSFYVVNKTSWSSIIDAMKKVYLEGYQPSSSAESFMYKDPGYLFFQKICQIFTDDYQIYLIIIAVILFVTMARFIYKYSDDPCISFIVFSTLFYSFFAITGHRQSLATALVVFLGFDFIKERKLIPFLLVSAVAYTLHKSAIIFVPFYLLGAKKVSWPYISILAFVTLVSYAAGPAFILEVAEMIGYARDDVYELPPYTYVFALSLVGITTAVLHKHILALSEFKNWEIVATLFATMFGILALIDQNIMRVQQYFGLFLMLSIPSIFSLFKGDSKKILKFAFVCFLIMYLINNNPQYQFFWQ